MEVVKKLLSVFLVSDWPFCDYDLDLTVKETEEINLDIYLKKAKFHTSGMDT